MTTARSTSGSKLAAVLAAPGRVLRSPVLWRIAAALLGGYAFCWGLIALCVAGLYSLGMAFHDAESLGAILGFLAYLAAFLWAFGAARLLPVWCVLLGGGAAMAGLATLLQSRLMA